MKWHLGYSIGVGGKKERLEDVVYAAEKHLAPSGVDCLIVQVDNGFQIQSAPEISDGDITARDLRDAADRVRRAGMDFIPLYNCIGHQGWKNRNGLLRAHPDFDETPSIADDAFKLPCRHADGTIDMLDVSPGWCMNEPKVFDVVLPIVDELMDATKCSTMHLGMDEIFWFNQCARCRDIPPRELFYQNFMRLYDHLHDRNVKTMIWADRLVSAKKLLHQTDPQRRWWDYDTYGASDCLPDIPKDVVACNWHYDVEKTYPSTGELMRSGVSAFPSCWRNADAAEAIWKDALRQARELDREDKLYGLLVTYWGYPADGLTGLFEKTPGEAKDRESLETFRRAAAMLR